MNRALELPIRRYYPKAKTPKPSQFLFTKPPIAARPHLLVLRSSSTVAKVAGDLSFSSPSIPTMLASRLFRAPAGRTALRQVSRPAYVQVRKIRCWEYSKSMAADANIADCLPRILSQPDLDTDG